jgi:hypothetical protein
MSVNNIQSAQNHPDCIALLRARRRITGRAKLIQGCYVLFSIAVPFTNVFVPSNEITLKAALALISILMLLLDVAWLGPWQNSLVKHSAILQEDFDTKVLELPWNDFVAGDKVGPELIRKASAKPLSAKDEAGFANWYTPCVEEIPLYMARLLCQRSNILYDLQIRLKYSIGLLSIAIILGGGTLFYGLVRHLSLEDLALFSLMPLMPIMSFALREFRKQRDSASTLERLKGQVESLWKDGLKGKTADQVETKSRELQDAIFHHRTRSPLVYDWAYWWMRKTNEDTVSHGVKQMVSEVKPMFQL